MSKKSELDQPRARKRIATIKRQIAHVDLVCSGTLLQRTKVCGKPNCRCATDREARHGPYYEWNRLVEGKLRHTAVSEGEVKQLQRALHSYRRILELLAQWQQQSIELILPQSAKARPSKVLRSGRSQ